MDMELWDEFAEEYTAIQAESQTTIAADVASFLVAQQILPTGTFVDLAGGSGKYVPAIYPYVAHYELVDFSQEMLRIARATLTENITATWLSQADFFQRTDQQRADVVFSAMNPALQTEAELKQLLRTGHVICILRVVDEADTLFTPFEMEARPTEWALNEQYSTWHPEFQRQRFHYQWQETCSRALFQTYFDQLSEAEVTRIFDNKETQEYQATITFELLYSKGVYDEE